MKECDKLLLESLNSYMNGRTVKSDFDAETAEELIECARKHKVFPIVYLENSEGFANALNFQSFIKIKTEVMLSVSAQVQRSSETVRIYNLLKKNGIKSIIFKGAVCRAMYSNPEYRISSDEDFLVGTENMQRAAEILISDGYEIIDSKGGEIKLFGRVLNSIIELHSSVVDECISDAYSEIGSMLRRQLESPVMTDIGCGEIATFSRSHGFLSLCMHFYNHFIIGGIGIRPVMDVACFIKKYEDEIDFDFCFSVLRTVNAEKLIKTLIALCNKVFETDCKYADNENAVDMLLEDILSAGAYGTAEESRMHSGTVTKSLAHGKNGILSAVFLSDSEIISAHPEFKGNNKEIRKYRIKRVVGFAGRKGKLNVLQSTGKRKKLLKAVGIIG